MECFMCNSRPADLQLRVIPCHDSFKKSRFTITILNCLCQPSQYASKIRHIIQINLRAIMEVFKTGKVWPTGVFIKSGDYAQQWVHHSPAG